MSEKGEKRELFSTQNIVGGIIAFGILMKIVNEYLTFSQSGQMTDAQIRAFCQNYGMPGNPSATDFEPLKEIVLADGVEATFGYAVQKSRAGTGRIQRCYISRSRPNRQGGGEIHRQVHGDFAWSHNRSPLHYQHRSMS